MTEIENHTEIENNTKTENYNGGPRTEEGKQRSSQNAVKHGLFARNPLIEGESQDQFDQHLAKYARTHNPKGAQEEDLVRHLALIEWRRRRIPALEARAMDIAIESGDPELKCLNNYTVYGQRLNREFQTTLKTLKDLQAERIRENGIAFRFASMLRKYFNALKRPWNPADDGFVFSLAQIDRAIVLWDKLVAADKTSNVYADPGEIDAFMAKIVA